MNLRDKTILFANHKLGSVFQWGTNDCNTIGLEFIKYIAPDREQILQEVQHKYKSKIGAVKFYTNFKYTWEDYLKSVGFEKVSFLYFQPGDIHLHPMGEFLKSISINVGETNLIADEKFGIVLQDAFILNDTTELICYRLKE